MEFKRTKSVNSEDFKRAWRIYESSFPSDERREITQQVKLLKNMAYSFYVVYDNSLLVGMLADWVLEEFLFIEHLAIEEDLRGEGLGTRMLKEYLNKADKKIFFEVEKPTNDVAKKRIRFYKKLGFILNKYDYIQPPYSKSKNPVPMFLMSFPTKIEKPEFVSAREKIHKIVYGLKKPLLKI